MGGNGLWCWPRSRRWRSAWAGVHDLRLTGTMADVIPDSFDVLTLDTPYEVSGATIRHQVTLEDLTGGVVPEPATWALLVPGFWLVGAALRQRRRTAMHAPS